jgi:hypothetical protein
MSGHTRWERRLEPLPVGALVQYTRGYLLALEDILKDSEDSSCLADLQTKIQETQAQANRTLELLCNQIRQDPF